MCVVSMYIDIWGTSGAIERNQLFLKIESIRTFCKSEHISNKVCEFLLVWELKLERTQNNAKVPKSGNKSK